MAVDFAVMHVPDSGRRHYVDAMLQQIPQLTIVEDVARDGAWPTAKRAFTSEGDGSHICVMQDDVLLCRDFPETVETMVHAVPNGVLFLYSQRKAVRDALAAGKHWIRCRDPIMAQAIVMPRMMVELWLKWLAMKGIEDSWHPEWDDVRLCLFLLGVDVAAWMPCPSIVEHGEPSDSTVSAKHNNAARVATEFIGTEVSGLVVDWYRGLLQPEVVGSTSFEAYWKSCGL